MPEAAQPLIDRISRMMPRVKITELLTDVDDWTGFTGHFVHLKADEPAKDRTLLLSAVLADGINLALTRMADSSPEATYDRLAWLEAWHVRCSSIGSGRSATGASSSSATGRAG